MRVLCCISYIHYGRSFWNNWQSFLYLEAKRDKLEINNADLIKGWSWNACWRKGIKVNPSPYKNPLRTYFYFLMAWQWKITIHSLTSFRSNHLTPNSEKRTRDSHAFKFRMPEVCKDVFKFSFFPRPITEWNSLPADLVNCKSLSDFKLTLGKHMK